jgi:hypothetical protein
MSRGTIHRAKTAMIFLTGIPGRCDRVRMSPYQTRMRSTRPPYTATRPRKRPVVAWS